MISPSVRMNLKAFDCNFAGWLVYEATGSESLDVAHEHDDTLRQ